MKYIVDTKTLSGFVQCISLPDWTDQMCYPKAEQVRGGVVLLERLVSLIGDSKEKIRWCDMNYHSLQDAKDAFDYGSTIQSVGDPLLLSIIKARDITLMANSTVLFLRVKDANALLKVLKSAIKSAES